MKKENEGYFVIKFKNKDKYITDYCFYPNLIEDAKPFETRINLIEDAKPFETRTKAYEYMKRYSLDKECIVVEIK